MNDPDNPKRSKAHSLIDEHLKLVYGQLEEEALPDRFQDLLSELRKKDAASEKSVK